MMYQSLVEALQDKVESNKGIVFIEGSDKETFVPYHQLYQKAGRNLLSLQQRGINPKDELIVMLDNNEYFLHAVWAAFLGGIIPVPVSVGLNDEHRRKLFKIWDILNNPYLITNKETYAKIEEFAIQQGMDDRQAALKYRTVFYEELDRSDQCGEIRNARPEEIAFIQFSSGSTGDPKGVTLTHKNLLTNINAIIESSEITGHDSFLSWMPLTHDMGFIGCHLVPLCKGINLSLMPTSLFIRRPTLWLEKVSEHRVSLATSPNFGYKHYLGFYKKKKKSDLDLSCVRLIYNGAEPISIPLCHDFLDEMAGYGLKRNTMYTVYGLAEASLAVTFPTAGEEVKSVKVDRGSLAIGQKVIEENEDSAKSIDFADVGYPVKDCFVRIADENNNVLEENFVGYVQIKGDNVTKGYYNNPSETGKVITKDGWLNTGDLGFIKNQRLFLTGRAKDIIFVNGQNFYPHDLERISETIDGIELGKIAVCGLYNKDLHQDQILAFLLFKKGAGDFLPLRSELKKHIMKQIGLEIAEVIPVRKIPKTTSGKIQRYQLANMYEKGDFDDILRKIKELSATEEQGESIELPKTELEEQLVALCKDVMGVSSIGINDNFIEYGGNSLLLTKIQDKLDKLYPGKLKITDFFEYPTISQIAKLIQSNNHFAFKGIKLPADYFDNPSDRLSDFTYCLNGRVLLDLKTIARAESVEISNILLSAFIYLLKEITEKNEINVEVVTDYLEFIMSLNIDFSSESDDFGTYFRKVHQILKSKDLNRLYSLYDIKRLNPVKGKHTIIPLFYEKRHFNSPINLLDVYEIALEVNEVDESIHLTLQYDSKRLNKEKVKGLFENYIQCVYLFVKNYIQGEIAV